MSTPEKNFVTREKLFAEASRLKASGTEPSVRKLLRALGGSATTISGLLREWRGQEGIEAPVASEDVEIPADVIAAAKLAAAEIWQVCSVEAQGKINGVTEKANKRIQEAQSDRDQALVELAESETELIGSQKRAAELESEIAVVRQAVTTAASTEAGLRAAADQMSLQIEAQVTELQHVHSEHEHARVAHSSELTRLADDFGRQLAAQVAAANSAQAQTANVLDMLEQQTSLLQAATEREGRVTTDLVKAQGELARVIAQLDGAKAASAQVELGLREQLENYRDQLAVQTRQREAATNECDALRGQASDVAVSLREQLAGLRDQVSSLSAQRDATAGERDALRAQISSQLEVITALSNARHNGDVSKADSGKAPVRAKKPAKPDHVG